MRVEHAKHLLAGYLASNIAFSTTFGGLLNSVVDNREVTKVLKWGLMALQYTPIAVQRIPAVSKERWEAACVPRAHTLCRMWSLKKRKHFQTGQNCTFVMVIYAGCLSQSASKPGAQKCECVVKTCFVYL